MTVAMYSESDISERFPSARVRYPEGAAGDEGVVVEQIGRELSRIRCGIPRHKVRIELDEQLLLGMKPIMLIGDEVA